MTEIRHVTGTAFVVAEFRARENAEPHPLYVDRIVPIFLDARTKQAADVIAAGFRRLKRTSGSGLATSTTGSTSSSPAAAGRSLSWARGSTRGPCANGRRASPISRSTTQAP
jgi:hypothetical protein